MLLLSIRVDWLVFCTSAYYGRYQSLEISCVLGGMLNKMIEPLPCFMKIQLRHGNQSVQMADEGCKNPGPAKDTVSVHLVAVIGGQI